MFVGCFMGCNSTSNGDDPILKEAFDIHIEALAIEKDFKPLFDDLVNKKNSLAVQGRELTPEEMVFIDRVSLLEESYEIWEENHIEVPGFEDHEAHDHSHHGHDHSHGPAIQLLPEDMLIVQKEFRDSVIAMKGRAELLLKK